MPFSSLNRVLQGLFLPNWEMQWTWIVWISKATNWRVVSRLNLGGWQISVSSPSNRAVHIGSLCCQTCALIHHHPVFLTYNNKDYLIANDNMLTGPIPSEFGLMTNMTRFEIFNNDLSGTVPSELGVMLNLDIFQLYQNPKMTGTVPSEVCALWQFELEILMVQCQSGDVGIGCPDGCCTCRKG